jgi:cell division protease FtsH
MTAAPSGGTLDGRVMVRRPRTLALSSPLPAVGDWRLRAVVAAMLVILALLVVTASAAAAPFVFAPPPGGSASVAYGDGFAYSDLVRAMRNGRVDRAVLDPERGEAEVWLSGGRREEVAYPPAGDLADRLTAAGARVEVRRRGGGRSLITMLLLSITAIAVLIWLIMRFSRRSRVEVPPTGDRPDSKAPASGDRRPQARFADVAGCDEAVDELREFVTFLRHPARFTRVGARIPSGLLLHGPPGTGKTLLARALAGEADVSFFAASGSEFMDRYVGVGASRVRQLFARARRLSGGAVVFIDELDAIGKRRSDAGDVGSSESDHTLNQLLVELDGFESSDRVVCVAATNRMELLDPALLRPGRLSRHVLIDLPSADGRRAILDVHARGKPLADDVELGRLAEGTAGCSGADLAEVLNEGAILAARADRDRITHADLEEAHLRVLAGPPRRSSPLTEAERKVVAHHEAGHALVAEFCATCDKTGRLTIRPRGRAAGLAVPTRRDRTLHSAQYVHEQMMVLLAGRAAERAVYGHVSSGAANDLQQANTLARRAITELGFSPRAGQLVDSMQGRMIRLAETTHQVIDEEVERMIAEAYRDAIAMVEHHREPLDRLARALLASEELDRLEIAAALGEPPQRRPGIRRPPGPRPEPALHRPEERARHPASPRRRVRRSLAPALAVVRTALTGRPERRGGAPIA